MWWIRKHLLCKSDVVLGLPYVSVFLFSDNKRDIPFTFQKVCRITHHIDDIAGNIVEYDSTSYII